MTRRIFFRRTGAVSALLSCARPGRADETKGLEWKGGELGTASFRLSLSPADGLKNTRLTHAPSGLLLADGDYSYSFGRPTFRESRSSRAPDGSSLISLRGRSEEHTSELQSPCNLVCRLLLEKKKRKRP